MKFQKALAVVLSAMMVLSGMVFSASATSGTAAIASVRFDSDTVIHSWDDRSQNAEGNVCTGSSTTAIYNSVSESIDASASLANGNNFVLMYFDSTAQVLSSVPSYCFAVLYKTQSDAITAGYYASNYLGNGWASTSAQGRPSYTTQTITVNGDDYLLATATLDMTNTDVIPGTKITGLRVNLPKANQTYSFYGAGAFLSEEDAVAYFQADHDAPVFDNGMAIQATGATNSSLTVSWTAATDEFTSAANMTYHIYAATSAITSQNLSSAVLAATVTGVTVATLGNLAPGTAYYLAVQAEDEAGNTALWASSGTYSTSSLDHKVKTLGMVDFHQSSPIFTDGGETTSGSFFAKDSATYHSQKDAIVITATGANPFVCNFDEICLLDASENEFAYVAVLYAGDKNLIGNGYLMDGLVADGRVYNNGYIRPAFDVITCIHGGQKMKIAYAVVDVSLGGYDGKKVYGVRTPSVPGTYEVHAAGVFGSFADMMAVFADSTAPVLDVQTVEAAGSGLNWQLSWSAADNVSASDDFSYQFYFSNEAAAELTGEPNMTVKGVEEISLAGLAANATNYVSLSVRDAMGNTSEYLNVCTVVTSYATAKAFARYGNETTFLTSATGIKGGTILTVGGAAAEYDGDTDSAKVTLTASGNDYFCAFLDASYKIDHASDSDLCLAVWYQSERDIKGNGFLLPTFSTSVANQGTVTLKPSYSSKSIVRNGETYKLAYAFIDVSVHNYFGDISGFRFPASLGSNAGVDFYIYGIGVFPTLADAEAAYGDTEEMVFESEVSAYARSSGLYLNWNEATDDVLYGDSIQYTVYASNQIITAENIALINTYQVVRGNAFATIRNLSSNTQYYYAVVAEDAAGNKTLWCSSERVTPLDLGDVNADRSINASDLVSLRKCLLGVISGPVYDCDVNIDSEMNICDLVALKKILIESE